MDNGELKRLSVQMLGALDEEMRLVMKMDERTDPFYDPFYGMLHYHMGWVDANFEPVSIYNGKQIRPLMVMLTCHAAGGDWRQAVPAAAAVEMLHNFSLIHDDIEDHSDTRRGRLTLWKIWGMEQAINSGDALFGLAHLAMNRLIERGVGAETAVFALRRFDETCVHLTNGQYHDMDFETRDTVSVDEYVQMITGKTAALLSHSAELGAVVAGVDAETIAHYAAFGLNVGLAFQVKDDVLGIWGDEALTGKSAATDISTKKKTLPVLYGLSRSSALRDLYQAESPSGFVEKAIALLDEAGARGYAEGETAVYSQQAIQQLTAADPQGNALFQLADMLLTRQK